MSSFWSAWVVFFVVFNWVLVTFLLVYSVRVPIPTEADGTTGHVWAHGALREGVKRLPLWWILLSAAMLVSGVVYLVLYPGLGRFGGTLGWSATGQLEAELERHGAQQAPLFERVRSSTIDALADDPDVVRAASVLYEDYCAACHGADGGGSLALGAPNLTDDAWLYGDGEAVRASIAQGRSGVMPALGQVLGEDGVREVAAYVYGLSGRQDADAALSAAGKQRYGQLCIACHGPDGTGNTQLGAPDLTDSSWLYGGGLADIETSVRLGRQGKMPAWQDRLGTEQISMLMAWIQASGPAGATRSVSGSGQ